MNYHAPMLIRQCAWCNDMLGQMAGDAEGISHGICEPCMVNVLNDCQCERSHSTSTVLVASEGY